MSCLPALSSVSSPISTPPPSVADDDAGTLLRLEHHELAGKALRENHLLAWRSYLARLAIAVTGADPGRDPLSL
jgi:hypothetical protein